MDSAKKKNLLQLIVIACFSLAIIGGLLLIEPPADIQKLSQTSQTNETMYANSVMALAMPSSSLKINETIIPYESSRFANTAPANEAGLWMGSDSTTDNSYGYFIGHHPGIFDCVPTLTVGDKVVVCDMLGHKRMYTVRVLLDFPSSATWGNVKPFVSGYGESIILQTCMGSADRRVVVAN